MFSAKVPKLLFSLLEFQKERIPGQVKWRQAPCVSSSWSYPTGQSRQQFFENKDCSAPSSTRNSHQEHKLPSSRLPLSQKVGGCGKGKLKCHRALLLDFSHFFPWSSIHLVAINLWLFSRVLLMLILTVFLAFLSVSLKEWPLGLPTPQFSLPSLVFIDAY